MVEANELKKELRLLEGSHRLLALVALTGEGLSLDPKEEINHWCRQVR